MTDTDWHVPEALLRRFTEDPAAIDDPTASSLEAHLVACERCRAAIAAGTSRAVLAGSWDAIADRIDRPRRLLVERVLDRLGIGSSTARLVGATASMRAAALVAVLAMAGGAAALSRSADAEGPFLVLAPLLPLAAVALAFVPAADPGTEAAVAAPLNGIGLVVRRTVAVLVVTFTSLGLAAFALPDLGVAAAAWVLPALALATGALCLGTWMRIETAVGVLALGWLMTVSSVRWFTASDAAYAATPTFGPPGQLTALVLALVAAALVVVRRDRFATLEVNR